MIDTEDHYFGMPSVVTDSNKDGVGFKVIEICWGQDSHMVSK